VDPSGSLDKLNDLHGSAYVSSDGDVWVADREKNASKMLRSSKASCGTITSLASLASKV